jgi:hypothetical protein
MKGIDAIGRSWFTMPSKLAAIFVALLFAPSVHAYDVGDWPQQQLEATAASVLPAESTVISAQGVPLEHAGPTTGVILAKHRQGEHSYVQVLTTFVKNGETWVSGGWGVGGCDEAVVLGVLDLAAPGVLELSANWAGPNPQEPVAAPTRPVLAVLSRERYDDGIERIELLLLDIADPEKPWQLLRARAGTRLPIWDPRSDRPVQRSLGTRVQRIAMVLGDQGPELQLTQRKIPTPDSRCREPEPETRHFLFQEGRFVEEHPGRLHEDCP